jgi:hypothetical protein
MVKMNEQSDTGFWFLQMALEISYRRPSAFQEDVYAQIIHCSDEFCVLERDAV